MTHLKAHQNLLPLSWMLVAAASAAEPAVNLDGKRCYNVITFTITPGVENVSPPGFSLRKPRAIEARIGNYGIRERSYSDTANYEVQFYDAENMLHKKLALETFAIINREALGTRYVRYKESSVWINYDKKITRLEVIHLKSEKNAEKIVLDIPIKLLPCS